MYIIKFVEAAYEIFFFANETGERILCELKSTLNRLDARGSRQWVTGNRTPPAKHDYEIEIEYI